MSIVSGRCRVDVSFCANSVQFDHTPRSRSARLATIVLSWYREMTSECNEDRIRLQPKPLALGDLRLRSRYWLSPLAGYTNLPFRLAVRELGGLGLATTDLVNARALLRANSRTLELIQTCLEDRPVAVQIYGSESKEMAEAARWLEDYGVSVIDIN